LCSAAGVPSAAASTAPLHRAVHPAAAGFLALAGAGAIGIARRKGVR
jgi:hypothetical protein